LNKFKKITTNQLLLIIGILKFYQLKHMKKEKDFLKLLEYVQ